ncbi:ABC-type methionine transport system ATPase subunit [Bradyrhizobium liaoningense]
MIGDSLPVSLSSRIVPEPLAGGHAVIRIQVGGAGAGDTLVARLAREIGRDVSLLSARIDEIGGQHVGSLVLGIPLGVSSGADAVKRTLAFMSQHQFPAEHLGYVA